MHTIEYLQLVPGLTKKKEKDKAKFVAVAAASTKMLVVYFLMGNDRVCVAAVGQCLAVCL